METRGSITWNSQLSIKVGIIDKAGAIHIIILIVYLICETFDSCRCE